MIYDAAVIIVNYNSSDYTINCIKSILHHTSEKLNYHITIVDNASHPDETNKLGAIENKTGINIIYNDKNVGFGAANMLGAKQCEAEYLFFLNNDCLLLNDCISLLIDFCANNPLAGMCGPQMYSGTGEKILSFNYTPTPALKFLGPSVLRLFYPFRYPKRNKQYDTPLKVDLVPGSGLFIRAKAFKAIGGFDPNLFFYCEEEDLAERLKALKWNVYFIPAAKYIHYGGGSSESDLIMVKEYYISLMYFFRKHYSKASYIVLKILYGLKLMKKSINDRRYLPLVGFILNGAPLKYSLRYRQS